MNANIAISQLVVLGLASTPVIVAWRRRVQKRKPRWVFEVKPREIERHLGIVPTFWKGLRR